VGNTLRRRQNSSAAKETEQPSTRSEAVAAVEECKKRSQTIQSTTFETKIENNECQRTQIADKVFGLYK